jgi:hypothetical protein
MGHMQLKVQHLPLSPVIKFLCIWLAAASWLAYSSALKADVTYSSKRRLTSTGLHGVTPACVPNKHTNVNLSDSWQSSDIQLPNWTFHNGNYYRAQPDCNSYDDYQSDQPCWGPGSCASSWRYCQSTSANQPNQWGARKEKSSRSLVF